MRCEERQKQPKTDKRVILKGDCSLDTLFQGYWRNSKWSGLLTGQGTLCNQCDNEHFKGAARNVQNGKKRYGKGDFQKRQRS